MSEFRDFNATNAPNTCLWCGNKLRRKAWVKRERTGKYRAPRACAYCGHRGKFEINPDHEGWFRCSDCGEESYGSPVEHVTEREYAYDKPGDYGDGHFCGLRCGYSFGVSMADSGQKFNARKPA